MFARDNTRFSINLINILCFNAIIVLLNSKIDNHRIRRSKNLMMMIRFIMINEPRNINSQCGAQDNTVTFLASLKNFCVIGQEIIIFSYCNY